MTVFTQTSKRYLLPLIYNTGHTKYTFIPSPRNPVEISQTPGFHRTMVKKHWSIWSKKADPFKESNKPFFRSSYFESKFSSHNNNIINNNNNSNNNKTVDKKVWEKSRQG